uniref:(northern house mosquito) hypothetical protein n=1 Tax=Culex pipiens TaxID=7175 RepID=A0A8D8AEX8_CULPI
MSVLGSKSTRLGLVYTWKDLTAYQQQIAFWYSSLASSSGFPRYQIAKSGWSTVWKHVVCIGERNIQLKFQYVRLLRESGLPSRARRKAKSPQAERIIVLARSWQEPAVTECF